MAAGARPGDVEHSDMLLREERTQVLSPSITSTGRPSARQSSSVAAVPPVGVPKVTISVASLSRTLHRVRAR
jgi:hypothetical protein